MLRQRIGQILSTWKRRAVETGYIQYIPPSENIRRGNQAIRVVLSPVASGGGMAADLEPIPVWALAGEMMNPIKKSYNAEV
jgi:hypothetical protein